MTDHKVVRHEEWQAARNGLLQREKEHTRLGDELAHQRRELPWVAVEKEYRFDTDDGTRTLAELFDGRSQLLIYHFMFGPSYRAGCPVNSSMADGLDGLLAHLHARDVTLLLVSQAPLAKLAAYKKRMGWGLPWVERSTEEIDDRARQAWSTANLGDSTMNDPADAASAAAVIRTLSPKAAKMVAVEILLSDPESLLDDVFESCLYIVRERLRES
jgi:predicted dithiol-disulfide oxidoreductase (DUF899 family)